MNLGYINEILLRICRDITGNIERFGFLKILRLLLKKPLQIVHILPWVLPGRSRDWNWPRPRDCEFSVTHFHSLVVAAYFGLCRDFRFRGNDVGVRGCGKWGASKKPFIYSKKRERSDHARCIGRSGAIA